MFRRHPILTLLGLLGIAGLLSAVYFLATFDLNRYREELQSRLSTALSQPVRLGEARLSLTPGPAFEFTAIEIGQKTERLLEAERLSLQTELMPLLIGRFNFKKIVLHRPIAQLTLLPGSESAKPRPSELLHKILRSVRVHSLEIVQGSLQFSDLRRQDQPFRLQLTDIQLQAKDIYSRERGSLRFSSQLGEQTESRLQVNGRLTLPQDLTNWREIWLELSASLQSIDPNSLLRHYAKRLGCSGSKGQLYLAVALRGSPEEELTVDSSLAGKDLFLQLPKHSPQKPFALSRAGLSGSWRSDKALSCFDHLQLTLNDLLLKGHFSLQTGEGDPWLEGGLSTPELPLTALARLLPRDWLIFNHPLQELTAGGSLQLAYSRFAGPLSQFRQQDLPQSIKEATLYLKNGRFRFGQGPLFSDVATTFTWKEQRLSLTDGSAQILDSPLHFSGTIDKPFQADATAILGAGWVLPGRKLPELSDNSQWQSLAAQGPIPISFNTDGPLNKLKWLVQADMRSCNLSYGQLLTKPAGLPSGINLQGELSSNELQLTKGEVQVGPARMSLGGRYQLQDSQEFALQATLADTELADLLPLLPGLERFQLQGRLAGNYSLQGANRVLQENRGRLNVRKLGVNFPGILGGELRQFSGNIELFSDRIEWRGLKGLLGQSAVTLGGKVSNWSRPRVELNLTAPRLRANELIFPSPKARLRDLSGQLVFVDRRVEFNDMQVTLDGGSRVAVNGQLSTGEQLEVNLTATSKRANVDQVVALWQHRQKKPRSGKKQRAKVVVNAKVAEGTYHKLLFKNATATITSTAGLLRISPLQFETGGGHCLAQIAIQQNLAGKPLLTVSGHADMVESGSLKYLKLLDKKGLLSGPMEGDFHLAGDLGKNFWPTSRGAFRLAIEDGVLNKFTFLAKVFSLLNVSQLFSLKLPDMVEEGMPFTSLAGSFQLRDGILSTEDLFVTSNAMNLSLVGDSDLVKNELDLVLGIKPLRTVDKVVTRIPIAGWLLTGEEKALITAHFEITGPSSAPRVQPIPVSSLSGKVLGIFKRVLSLPGKLVTEPGEVLTGQPSEQAPPKP